MCREKDIFGPKLSGHSSSNGKKEKKSARNMEAKEFLFKVSVWIG